MTTLYLIALVLAVPTEAAIIRAALRGVMRHGSD